MPYRALSGLLICLKNIVNKLENKLSNKLNIKSQTKKDNQHHIIYYIQHPEKKIYWRDRKKTSRVSGIS